MQFLPDDKFLQGKIPDAACNTGRNHAVHTDLPDPRSSVKFSVFRRQKLRRNRCIQYIIQCIGKLLVLTGIRIITHQMPDQCLWHRSIHGIHGHMISVVRCPPQCKFRQISGSDHKRIFLFAMSIRICVRSRAWEFSYVTSCTEGSCPISENAHLPPDRYPLPQILPQGFESV